MPSNDKRAWCRDYTWDDNFGWWNRLEGDRNPYRVQKGVFLAAKDRVVGIDLRKVADAQAVKVDEPITLVTDGATASADVVSQLLSLQCESCGVKSGLSLASQSSLSQDQLLCEGCGGMFNASTLTPFPLGLDWGARLEGRWKQGTESLVAERNPVTLSASGAQAEKAALRVAKVTSLRALQIGRVGDGPVLELEEQPHLRFLRIWYSDISDASVVHVGRYTTLQALNVGNNPGVSDGCRDALASLVNLRMLNLEQTDVGDATLEAIAELPKLEFVALARTKTTKKGLSALLKRRPGLTTQGWGAGF